MARLSEFTYPLGPACFYPDPHDRTQVTFVAGTLAPKKLSYPLTCEPEKAYLLEQTISAGDGFSRGRRWPAVAGSFGLERERRIASPLSGTTPDPCPKITSNRHGSPAAAPAPPLSQTSSRQIPCKLHQTEERGLPMPKKPACPVPCGVPPVSDLITDKEIAFAHLVLSGTMTDRRAAETAGLNPESASYTKARPRVRAYMIEHRTAVKEELVDQEANLSRLAAEQQSQLNMTRDQVRDRILNRLWELATLSHEVTRGSIAGQMKALAMIAAIEELIPDRRLSSEIGRA